MTTILHFMPYISFYLYSLYPYGLFLIFQYGIALYSLHPHTLITILHFMSHIFFYNLCPHALFQNFSIWDIKISSIFFVIFLVDLGQPLWLGTRLLSWVNPWIEFNNYKFFLIKYHNSIHVMSRKHDILRCC